MLPSILKLTRSQADRPKAWSRALPLTAIILCTAAGASAAQAAGPATVKLGLASRLTILSESGITDVPTSTVLGNVGVSPITGAADLLTCSEPTGFIFSVDAAGPAPCSIVDPAHLTTAVADMEAAYTDAASRAPDTTELGGGNIGGYVLPPGVYKWSTGVTIPTNITLKGAKNDVWIFQIAGDLTTASATSVLLSGGVLPRNVFWQVAGQATLGTSSVFEGTILSKTLIAMQTSAYICGRLLAQTAVTLQKNYVMGAY